MNPGFAVTEQSELQSPLAVRVTIRDHWTQAYITPWGNNNSNNINQLEIEVGLMKRILAEIL